MQPDIRDAALLWDMVEQAKTVSGFMQGRTLADFDSDLMLRHTTERCL
jgi:hypothetical protein